MSGGTATGKSQLICGAIEQARDRGDATVIYDPTGEFTQHFFRPGDVILSPLDARSPAWTPWAEIRHPSDALRISKSLVQLPVRGSSDPFWPTAAQHTLAALLLKLSRQPDRSICGLLKVLSDSSPADLAELLKGSPIGAIYAGAKDQENRMARSVLGTLLPYVDCLERSGT